VAKTQDKPDAVSADFIFVGDHPAVDFANTRVMTPAGPLDYLSAWADVIRWLSETKLGFLPDQGEGALARVIELRDAWKIELGRVAQGTTVTKDFVQRLNTLLAADSFHELLHVSGKNGFHVIRSPSKLTGGKLALALIARQIIQFLAEAQLEYVRRCANRDSCVLYFYDTTKNHRRQWCSTTTCGNRHKVAAFRARRAKPDKLKRSIE
jgi:predicted RNA-binding Zn ribbon-like protein